MAWGVLAGVAALSLGEGYRPDPRITPQLYEHLEYASAMATRGAADKAISHASLILLPEAITIRLEGGTASGADRERAHRAVANAARIWENALGGEVEFRFVQSGAAQIIVRIDERAVLNGKHVAGRMSWTRESLPKGYRIHCDMAISTQGPGGLRLSDRAMTHAAGHELGHVLGLADDYRGEGFMAAVKPSAPVASPSQAEVSSLRRLRVLASDIIDRTVSARSS